MPKLSRRDETASTARVCFRLMLTACSQLEEHGGIFGGMSDSRPRRKGT